ncbi:hypothetical protein FD754_014214 [Muntiacus muntjak]|uniref:Sodium/potassium-transporting ATPase subunit beta-3 n=1 Tax=Muntiacus muntjak TaxID=9888 RepID=A0A5N3VJ58_MUNMU|nr:hypothetical protein FD754_014214 [Muntiacus muntjak]
MRKKDKKSFNRTLAEWKLFIYSRATGEFLGRTAKNWGLILFFYLVFYGFLAALFSFTDLTVFPKPVSELHFSFSLSDSESYQGRTEESHIVPVETFFEQKCPEYTAYQFPLALLEDCSGLDDPTFGYQIGNPCIPVKMSRIIGLKCHGEPKIDCIAKSESTVVLSTYPPNEKIDLKYFPYCGKILHGSNLQPTSCHPAELCLKTQNDHDKFSGQVTFKITMHA